jgi:hypothetical protein
MFLIGIFISIFTNITDCSEIQSIRNQYHIDKTSDELDSYIAYLEKINCNLAQPYLASSVMQKAEHSFLPTSKLKYFNSGKKMLEYFIEMNPDNIEAKYVRAMTQSEIPSFLGYNNAMKGDVDFIKKNIKSSDLPEDYQKIILKNINSISK